MLNAKKITADKHKDPLIAIIVSVIICSVLVVYPLNYTLAGWRPLIMLMVTLFWILCQQIRRHATADSNQRQNRQQTH